MLKHGYNTSNQPERTVFGAKSIGKTKAYLKDKDIGFSLDFGFNYKKWEYYEVYLKPRTSKGFHDLIRLGVFRVVRHPK